MLAIKQRAAKPPLEWLCIVAEAMIDLDYTGSAVLRTAVDKLHAAGITLSCSGLGSWGN